MPITTEAARIEAEKRRKEIIGNHVPDKDRAEYNRLNQELKDYYQLPLPTKKPKR